MIETNHIVPKQVRFHKKKKSNEGSSVSELAYGVGLSYTDYSQSELYDKLKTRGYISSYREKVRLDAKIGAGFNKINDSFQLTDLSAKLGVLFKKSGSNFNIEYLLKQGGTQSLVSKNKVFISLDSLPDFFKRIGFDIGGEMIKTREDIDYKLNLGVSSEIQKKMNLGLWVDLSSDGKPVVHTGIKWDL